MDYKQLSVDFTTRFGSKPRLFRSPGRINLIGEHTDYNDGFVLPAAVDKEICLLIAPNGRRETRIISLDEQAEVSFTFEDYRKTDETWAKYIIGVIDELLKANHKLTHVDILFSGDIPMGAGMSSSAALECATAFAYNAVFGLELSKWDIVKIAQAAENNFVGVKCGIMDQFASVFSQRNSAIQLDCRSLDYQVHPLQPDNYIFVLVDTMVKHALASSEYNARRAECEEGVAIIRDTYPEVNSLREVTKAMLNNCSARLSKQVYQRCSYVVEEISRVIAATEAMTNRDFVSLGMLLYKTHEGLQHQYAVSCEELDFLVDFTREKSYVLGARMMGGGFGGCTINLVEVEHVDTFIKEIQKAYQSVYKVNPSVYVVKTAKGSSEIN